MVKALTLYLTIMGLALRAADKIWDKRRDWN